MFDASKKNKINKLKVKTWLKSFDSGSNARAGWYFSVPPQIPSFGIDSNFCLTMSNKSCVYPMYEFKMPPTLMFQQILGTWKRIATRKKIFDKWSTNHRASRSENRSLTLVGKAKKAGLIARSEASRQKNLNWDF
jgi:hypothetical protein